jgi:hypothetical protein
MFLLLIIETASQHQTADFYTSPADIHLFKGRGLPFCATGAPRMLPSLYRPLGNDVNDM